MIFENVKKQIVIFVPIIFLIGIMIFNYFYTEKNLNVYRNRFKLFYSSNLNGKNN